MENLTLCVPRPSSKKDTHSAVLCRSSIPSEIPANHIVICVDRFGFSANNVTYQALGEAPHFRYFEFHAAPKADGVSPETHGVVPVWGFGDIVASNHPRIPVGERVYGYFAPTKYLLVPVSPSDVNKYSFFIPRPHLPADRRPYNQVTRCATDAQYDPSPLAEDMTMLYRPLFWTAFWCEDWLHASQYRGASNILISSASAKTAFCLAYLLQKRADSAPGVKNKVVGLTSKRNIAFTEGLKLYDEVVSYDAFEKMEVIRGEKWLYVDVAGNDELNARVQKYLTSVGTLVAGVQLGLTNLSPSAPTAATTKFTTNTDLSAPPPSGASGPSSMEQFFMPEWLAVRRRQLSVDRITSIQAEAWHALMTDGRDWVRIERVNGGPAVAQAYRDVAQKGTDPKTGMIWSLWDTPEIERAASTKL